MKTSIKVRALFIVLMYLFIEGTSYLGLVISEKKFNLTYDPRITSLSEQQKDLLRRFIGRTEARVVQQDPVLGWTNRFEGNSSSIRDDQEYTILPPSNVIRISAFGDSFTYGSDVSLNESWAKQLSSLDSMIEVLNYGVGAYGLDQSYLRYLQVGTEYHPHIVFIGYMSENIARNVNVFRAFYTRWYRHVIFTKPRFTVEDNALILLNNPISTIENHEYFLQNDTDVLHQLGEHDYHYQINYSRGTFDFLPSVRLSKMFWYACKKKLVSPIVTLEGIYNTESEAYRVTLKLFDAFYRETLENGALPIILVFPDIEDQRSSRQKKQRRYMPLLDDFRARGYRYIDLLEAFEPYEKQYTIKQLTRDWGHYSPLGNQIVAEYIFAQLQTWGFNNLPAINNIVEAEQQHMRDTIH